MVNSSSRASLLFPLGIMVAAADQISKLWVAATVSPGQSLPVIRGVLYITHVRNPGAAFGLFAGNTGLIVVVAFLLGTLVLYWARGVSSRWPSPVGIAIILGGALGNLVDRLRVGRVIDFIDFRFWPVFNLADVAIVLGAGMILRGIVLASREVSR